MMTPERILRRYEAGHVTETGLMLDVLRLTDEHDVVQALESMPEDVLDELREFVGYYTPKTSVFNGPRPDMQTVRFVKEWFVRREGATSKRRRTATARPDEPARQKEAGE
jgi:hypothetical protein